MTENKELIYTGARRDTSHNCTVLNSTPGEKIRLTLVVDARAFTN